MSQKTRFFELAESFGRDDQDNPEPLREIGLSICVPVVRGGELVQESRDVKIVPAEQLGDLGARIVPDTRLIEVAHPAIAEVMPAWIREIDPPTNAQLSKARDVTAAHRALVEERERAAKAPARKAAAKKPAPNDTAAAAATNQED